MTQIIISFSHANFAASKPTSNGEKKPPFFLQSLNQWNRSLLKTGLCKIPFILTVLKQKQSLEVQIKILKSFTYLNSYRVCMLGRGGKQTKENPNSQIYKS